MNHPYEQLKEHHFWKTGVAAKDPDMLEAIIPPEIAQLLLEKKIMSAGSCFAENIANELKRRNLKYLDYEKYNGTGICKEEYGYNRFSARYGNIYTTIQLRELLEESLKIRDIDCIIWRDNNDQCFDALRPTIKLEFSKNEASILRSREAHLKAIYNLLHDCEVFIFTMGLTEYWQDVQTGRALPLAPGVRCGTYKPNMHQHKNQDYQDVYSNLMKALMLIKSVNQDIKIILSVSPNPLTASYQPGNVLINNTESKAKLLVAAKQATESISECYYLPSFEIINNPVSKYNFFKSNLRQVNEIGVRTVMGYIFSDSETPIQASANELVRDATTNNNNEIIYDPTCDESILEFAAPRAINLKTKNSILFIGTSMAMGPTKTAINEVVNELSKELSISIESNIIAMGLTEFQIQSKEHIIRIKNNSIHSTFDFSAYSKYPQFTRRPQRFSLDDLGQYHTVFLIDCGFNLRITESILSALERNDFNDQISLINLLRQIRLVSGRLHLSHGNEIFLELLKVLDKLQSNVYMLPGPPEPLHNRGLLGNMYQKISKNLDLQELLSACHKSTLHQHCKKAKIIDYPKIMYSEEDKNFFANMYSRDYCSLSPITSNKPMDRHFNDIAASLVAGEVRNALLDICAQRR